MVIYFLLLLRSWESVDNNGMKSDFFNEDAELYCTVLLININMGDSQRVASTERTGLVLGDVLKEKGCFV